MGESQSKSEFEVSGPERDADGALRYRVRSPYQAGEALVRILLPEKEDATARRVLFVLPVEPGLGTQWGDGLRTLQGLDAHNRFGLIAVAPTFSDWPWYSDHPTDPALRQESHMLRVVVPLVERLHPHEPPRRGLLGFSKSGWGAFSLLLRNPDAFGAAVAWDAPLMWKRPAIGMERITGTQANFERYQVSRLLAERADVLRRSKRLGLFGSDGFPDDTRRAHALLDRLGIPHDYSDRLCVAHHWATGWMDTAVKSLSDMLK